VGLEEDTNPRLEAVPAEVSATSRTSLVLPPDTNHLGMVFGGRVLSFVDEVAAIAAMRHCRRTVVTASIDSVDFLSPIRNGQAISVEAAVSSTGNSSMEIHARVCGEDLLGGERELTATSFLTMIAVDECGSAVTVPPLQPQTEEQRRLHESAAERRRLRHRRQGYT